MTPHSPWRRFLGAVLLLLIFGLAAWLMISWAPAGDDDAARSAERIKAYADLQAENAVKLNTYAWIDHDKNIVQIPVQRAMELTAAELNARKPAPTGVIIPTNPAETNVVPSAPTF